MHSLWNCESYPKDCRNLKAQMQTKPGVKIVDDTISEAATIGTSDLTEEQVNQIETMFQTHSFYDANYNSDYDEFDDN